MNIISLVFQKIRHCQKSQTVKVEQQRDSIWNRAENYASVLLKTLS